MNSIELQQTLPAVFAGRDFIVSDVWHQSLQLKRGEAYLIEAASGTGKSSLSWLVPVFAATGILLRRAEPPVPPASIRVWLRSR